MLLAVAGLAAAALRPAPCPEPELVALGGTVSVGAALAAAVLVSRSSFPSLVLAAAACWGC